MSGVKNNEWGNKKSLFKPLEQTKRKPKPKPRNFSQYPTKASQWLSVA